MENKEKGLVFHFEDEKEVLNKYFPISGFISYNDSLMKIDHNGKLYKVVRKVTRLDANPIYIDLYLELVK